MKTPLTIKSISPLPKGMTKPQIDGEVVVYADDDTSAKSSLPKWLQEKIDNQIRQEPKPTPVTEAVEELDDDCPF